MFKRKDKQNRYSGFSFLEAIIAVFLVSFGIVAVLPMLTRNMQASLAARDNQIAAMLAQEGIELVRNVRDNNWASGGGKISFDSSNFPTANDNTNCRVSYNSAIVCGVATKLLKFRGGYYTYDFGALDDTKFRRKINISYYDASGASTNNLGAAYAIIQSEVAWDKTSDANIPAIASCSVGNKCVYTEVTLGKWGE